jgi:hypothetical protein
MVQMHTSIRSRLLLSRNLVRPRQSPFKTTFSASLIRFAGLKTVQSELHPPLCLATLGSAAVRKPCSTTNQTSKLCQGRFYLESCLRKSDAFCRFSKQDRRQYWLNLHQNEGFPGIRRGENLLGGLSRANTGQPVGMFRQQIRRRNRSAFTFFNGVVPTFFAGIL